MTCNTFTVVQCKGGSGAADVEWEVKRRYSEFEELHQKTEAEVPIYFPGKKLNFLMMSANKKCRRQMKLDKFLNCAAGCMTRDCEVLTCVGCEICDMCSQVRWV